MAERLTKNKNDPKMRTKNRKQTGRYFTLSDWWNESERDRIIWWGRACRLPRKQNDIAPKKQHRGRRSRGHHSALTHQLCVWFISGFSSAWFVLLQSYKTNKYVCGIFGPVCFAYCVSIQERFIEFENLHSKVIVKRRPDELCILNVELALRKVQNGVSIQSTVRTMSGVKRPLNLRAYGQRSEK